MKVEKVDFSLLGAQAPQGHKTIASFDDGFFGWLITNWAISEEWARNLTYNIGAILREVPDSFLDEDQAARIAREILTSSYAASTKKKKLTALERYMTYLGRPIKFKKPRDNARCPEYLDQGQMGRLIRVAATYQEMALVTLYCATGMRLSEAIQLDIRDLDFERKNIRVRHAKMDKQREIPMSDQLERVLRAYLSTLPFENRRPSDPLFRSTRGKRMARRTVDKVIKRLADRAGLHGVHTHVLRHSFATAWVDNDGDVLHLKDILGHSQIMMTERYWHLNTSKKKEAFKKAAPKL
jgi:integrase/recombinase XerC